ncbi:Asp-tRNA(Asn)/Glu-tRNA(Gln) amidotransferase subunit GatA [bacterium]|nr:Asp-tRNA(Asn)/Glu-tRNA(Gln) amidotransferase subunit GatA [bacterium]
MNLRNLTIKQIHQGLLKRDFSAVELAEYFLREIESKNPDLFAYLFFDKQKVLLQAKQVDEWISEGREISELAGIPFAVKDNILVEGIPCTAGSKILENYIAPYDATVIKKLKRKGAVVLGKTNLDEFAMGSSNEYSAFGICKNPYDKERVSGGSSGGSAAAVAANLAVFALGSDTGGSIRQPASFCGVVGLKPTYGAVSRFGLIAMASSLDQIGPITKTVEDAALVFDVIKGKDPSDSTSLEVKEKELEFNLSNLKAGIPKEFFIKGIDPDVEKVVKEAIKRIEEQGVKIKEVSLPHCTDYALATYYIIMPSEASSNLARYDGIRYGFSWPEAKDLQEVYFYSRAKGFGEEVRRRIMLGTFSLSSGYYDAYYLRAQKVRTLIRQDFQQAFEEVDVILTPTSPTVAFKIGERAKDPLSMYLSDIFVTAVNLAGLPAVSVPCGKAHQLPVGIQIIGEPFQEKKILKVGEFFEKL